MTMTKDSIFAQIKAAAALYHRLVFVVAESGSGKTKILREVSDELQAPFVNVNLELSRRMLDLTEKQRTLQLPRLLREIVDETDHDVVLLDNLEILFDVGLKQDPLRLLQSLSRNKTIVAAWNGAIDLSACNAQTGEQYLTYATPEHPEYKRYPVQDFLVASPEVTG